MATRSPEQGTVMRIPKQCPDGERSINPEIAQVGGEVAPAGFLDTLGTIAKIAAPIAASLL